MTWLPVFGTDAIEGRPVFIVPFPAMAEHFIVKPGMYIGDGETIDDPYHEREGYLS